MGKCGGEGDMFVLRAAIQVVPPLLFPLPLKPVRENLCDKCTDVLRK